MFALDGDTLYSAVDRKPKRSSTLRRIENARARPDVTILIDHYEENWGRLWLSCFTKSGSGVSVGLLVKGAARGTSFCFLC